MEIRRIPWQATIPLRHKVLWPSEKPAFCHVDGDEAAWHFGAFVDGVLVSVASVYFDGMSARLRKFATATQCQGMGIGSALLAHVLTEVRECGVVHFWCDARESAVGFYARFGLQQAGERFFKAGVPYFEMRVEWP